MRLLEIKSLFESKTDFLKFELLEFHHLAYCFGSGFISYRINGYLIKIDFDGKDENLDVSLTPRHEKYKSPSNNWTCFFNGTPQLFFKQGLDELFDKIQE
jgi:hypothetical protein